MPAYRLRTHADLVRRARERGWIEREVGAAAVDRLPAVAVTDAAGASAWLPEVDAPTQPSLHIRIPEAIIHGGNMSLLVEDEVFPGGLAHSFAPSPRWKAPVDGCILYEPRIRRSGPAQAELLGLVCHWGHFFVDALDRLLMLDQDRSAGPWLVSDPDLFGLKPQVDASHAVPQVSGLAQAMGIEWGDGRLEPVARDEDLPVTGLGVWTLRATKPSMSAQSARELRERVLARVPRVPRVPGAEAGGLLFVGREDVKKRVIRQQRQLIEALAARGADIVFPEYMTITQAIDAFSRAARVILPIGSAKFNLAFCRPGTQVLCVNPRGYSQLAGGVTQMVRHMCHALDLRLAFYEVEIEPAKMLLNSNLVFREDDVPGMEAAFERMTG